MFSIKQNDKDIWHVIKRYDHDLNYFYYGMDIIDEDCIFNTPFNHNKHKLLVFKSDKNTDQVDIESITSLDSTRDFFIKTDPVTDNDIKYPLLQSLINHFNIIYDVELVLK